ncbi:MAG: hypothetical protein IK081_11580 [Lachnospiraceae bacterium]|nr:hypothetical protein [Lachnospiraceae bacterium]
MNCKNCNAVMRVDQERKVFVCPYCEATEPFDGVSKAELQGMLHDAIRDVRKESIQEAQKNFQNQANQKNANSAGQKAKDVIILVLQIIFCIIVGFFSFLIFTDEKAVGFISLFQLALMITAIVMKKKHRVSRNPKQLLVKRICLILTGILVFFWFGALLHEFDGGSSKYASWPTQGLGSDLPKPEGKLKYTSSTTSGFSATFSAKKADYDQYVKKCKECGYSIDAEETDDSYLAYDENDNKLSVEYSKYSDDIRVDLDKGLTWRDFNWPDSELLNSVPVPTAEKSCLDELSKNGISIYVGEVTREQFEAYVQECINAGFEGYFRNGSDNFYGSNTKEKKRVKVDFQRNSQMYIDVYESSY